jgi:cytochrome c-type protein NapC
MNTTVTILSLFTAVVIILAVLTAFRAQLTRVPGGKVLAFVTLCILPALAVWTGLHEQLERSTSTRFCLSCHVMADFGRSLYVDDKSYLPASHFQNNRVPRDHACFTCHTDYTMFGDYRAKWRGMHHVWVQYFGTIPKPENIRLYTPYNNRECLHCHLGARSFEETSSHHKDPGMLAKVKANQLSCMSSNCHDIVHEVGTLSQVTFWKQEEEK